MGVLQEIIREATAQDGDIPRMLRLCLLLGKRLRHVPLTTWVQHELEGYPSDAALPSYRNFRCRSQGIFENIRYRATLDIPLAALPEAMRERYLTAEIHDGVGELVHLMKAGQDRGALHIPWPPEIAMLYLNKLAPGAHCVRAWSEISVAELAGALDQIKSKVLGFALDIEQEAPNAGDINGTDHLLLKEEKLTQIFNTNINDGGTVQNLANGSENFTQSVTTGIQPGDLPALLTALRAQGLAENDVSSLQDAITADKEESSMGGAVKKWIGDLASRAATGATTIGLDKVSSFIVPAISAYLGLPSPV
jgi:hypothetical protein